MTGETGKRILWFVMLWAAGVLAVAAVGLVIKLVLSQPAIE